MSEIPKINVQFPEHLEVRSKKLDAIQESTKAMADIMTNNFKYLIDSVQSLKKLPDLVEKLEMTFIEQFKLMFMTQIEADVLNRQANIRVLGKKMAFIEEHIEKKKEQARSMLDQITGRYKNLSEDLTKEHDTYQRKLDSHAFSIVEKVYPDQVQEKFSFESLPNISFLAAHADDSATVRTICLDDAYQDASKSVREFLNQRALFFNQLDDLCVDKIKPGNYSLPYWVIETEEISGGSGEFHFIYPWMISKSIKRPLPSLSGLLNEITNLNQEDGKNDREAGIIPLLIARMKSEGSLPTDELDRFSKDCKIN
jgi:hypothetical protein